MTYVQVVATEPRFPEITAADFAALRVEGLAPRMEAIKAGLRPKLERIGRLIAEQLEAPLGCPLFAHVAKHQRRTVTPPQDTWVAVSANPRGYKMQAHFQVGLWASHLFIRAGVIYEARDRHRFAQNLLTHLPRLRAELPDHFAWLDDYTRPCGRPQAAMSEAEFQEIARRLSTKRQADAMVGLEIGREEVLAMAPDRLEATVRETCQALVPVYLLA